MFKLHQPTALQQNFEQRARASPCPDLFYCGCMCATVDLHVNCENRERENSVVVVNDVRTALQKRLAQRHQAEAAWHEHVVKYFKLSSGAAGYLGEGAHETNATEQIYRTSAGGVPELSFMADRVMSAVQSAQKLKGKVR